MLGRRLLRGMSFGVLVLASFLAVSTTNVGGTAYALAGVPLPVGAPSGLGTGILSGAGEAVGIGGTAVEAGAAGAAVAAVAPAVIVVAGVAIIGTAIWVGTKWIGGHDPHQYDNPPNQVGAPGVGVTLACYEIACTYSVTVTEYTNDSANGYCNTGSQTCTRLGWSTTLSNAPSSSGRFKAYAMPGHVYAGSVEWGSVPPWVSQTLGYASLQLERENGAVVATFGLPGQPTPTGGPATPGMVTTTPTSQCSAGGSVAGTPVTYGWGDAAPPAFLFPACNGGATRTGLSTPTVSQATGNPINSTSGVAGVVGWTAPTVPGGFPQCQAQSGVSCVLTLYRVGFGTAAQSVACNTGNCAGWATQTTPSGATRNVLSPTGTTTAERPYTYPNGDHLDCYWGPYLMTTHSCDTYPTEGPTTPPPSSCTAGTMACEPASGTQTDTHTDGSNCSGSWSWNPVNWVLNPVKCALRWAFVPVDGALQTDMQTVQSGWAGNGVSRWVSAFGAVPIAVAGLGSGGGGCAGPHFTIALGGHSYGFDPLNACSGAMATVAAVFKVFATISLIVFGGRRLARMVLASIGMNSAV